MRCADSGVRVRVRVSVSVYKGCLGQVPAVVAGAFVGFNGLAGVRAKAVVPRWAVALAVVPVGLWVSLGLALGVRHGRGAGMGGGLDSGTGTGSGSCS